MNNNLAINSLLLWMTGEGADAGYLPRKGLFFTGAAQSRGHHLPAHQGQLGLQGDLHGAEDVAGHEADAAEDAFVGAHYFKDLGRGAVVPGVDHEPSHPVQAGRAQEILPDVSRGAGSDATAAFDAAFGFIDLQSDGVVHTFFHGLGIELFVGVNPGLGVLAHLTEPGAGIHREVAHQLEDRQGHEDDVLR